MSATANRVQDLVARHVAGPVSELAARWRPATRVSARTFAEAIRFRQGAAGWDAERKREWILARLRRAVRRAADTTPYYRELLASVGFDPADDFSFADYARLPVLERASIREAGDAILSTALPREALRRDSTGGSTGTPTVIWRGPEERAWASGTEYFMRRIGLPPRSRIGLLWGHHLDPVARSSARDRLHDWLHNLRWYDCLRLSPEQLLGYHRELQEWRPRGMICYAGALASLAEAVKGRSEPIAYPTHAFVTGAEKLYAHQRAVVREVFRRPVHERYGARDTGLLGFQVDPDRTLDYTIDWANVLVEPEGDDETSDILVTKLHGDGMPMLRYRVGDIGRFPAGARAGEPAFVLHEVVGRDVARLWLPDGRWMHGLSLPHLMKDHPVRDFQVRQSADYDVEVLVVPTARYDEASGRAIVGTVQANLPGLPVTLRVVDEIPRTASNKWNPVVSAVRASTPSAQVTR